MGKRGKYRKSTPQAEEERTKKERDLPLPRLERVRTGGARQRRAIINDVMANSAACERALVDAKGRQ